MRDEESSGGLAQHREEEWQLNKQKDNVGCISMLTNTVVLCSNQPSGLDGLCPKQYGPSGHSAAVQAEKHGNDQSLQSLY